MPVYLFFSGNGAHLQFQIFQLHKISVSAPVKMYPASAVHQWWFVKLLRVFLDEGGILLSFHLLLLAGLQYLGRPFDPDRLRVLEEVKRA